eukprot:4796241-Prymnesium_polylepis.2
MLIDTFKSGPSCRSRLKQSISYAGHPDCSLTRCTDHRPPWPADRGSASGRRDYRVASGYRTSLLCASDRARGDRVSVLVFMGVFRACLNPSVLRSRL